MSPLPSVHPVDCSEKEAALDAVTEDLEKGAWWDDFWPLMMADAYALCEEQERAFFWLEHAIDFGVTNVRYLEELDPFLVGLRSHDRFQELMRKAAGLAEDTASIVSIAELV